MLKKILPGFLLIILFLGGIGVMAVKSELKFFTVPADPNPVAVKPENVKPYFNRPVNILLIGSDQRQGDRGRSDTIALYHINPATAQVKVLAVPRDTYVNIPGRGMDKVNHTYAFGGVGLSRKTLELFLGIKVDYYVKTNFAGFVSLIDSLSGITIDVEKDIQAKGISKGLQKLDGQTALIYVRDRKDPMGDIARVKRQQKFMKGLAQELIKQKTDWSLALKIPTVYRNIETDLPLEGFKELALLLHKIDVEDTRMEVVPGWFYKHKGISYWKPDQDGTAAISREIFHD